MAVSYGIHVYKVTLQDRLQKWYPCPGCFSHNHPRKKLLFDRYYNRPQKSWLVYWKSHPKEYQQLLEAAGVKS